MEFAGLGWESGPSEGIEVETVPGGLMMPEGREMKKIWVKDPLEPDFFFKNQDREDLRINLIDL